MSALKSCNFCGHGPTDGVKVVSGKDANICKDCASDFKFLVKTSEESIIKVTRLCSFCGDYESERNPLILRTGCRAICRECIDKASMLIGRKVG